MKKNEIEDLFKKSFENYEADVSPGVWKNVRIGIKWGSLALLFNILLKKIGTNVIIALLSSAAVVISTVAIVNKKDNTSDKSQSATNTTKIAPSAIVEKQNPVIVSVDKNQSNNVEQKEENKETLSDNKIKADNNNEKTSLVAANINTESSKKESKKTESGLAKISKEAIASISASSVSGTAPLIIDLANKGTGKTNKWHYSDGKKGNSTSNPVHIFETPGLYSVILTSINTDGKSATDSIKVEVTSNLSKSSVPIELSINSDGVNDSLRLDIKNLAKMNLRIFDKKGSLYYKTENTSAKKWDGKDLQGKDVPEGVYFYILNAEGLDGKKYESKRSINLTR